MTIEIVVYNIESALQAQLGGANRIELCASPGDGGTTPSYGVIAQVLEKLSIDVYVMIRPRGGDFCYTADEFQSMRHDIEACKKLRAHGIVFGILTNDGRIDLKRCKALIELARPMRVTCHRAFDMSRDPIESLEDCVAAGFDRILTSGQMPKAIQGVELIAELVEKAGERISIMPGSGVNEDTVVEVVSKTKAKEIHFSALTSRASEMTYVNQNISGMGSDEGSEFLVRTVDPERIRRTRELAEKCL